MTKTQNRFGPPEADWHCDLSFGIFGHSSTPKPLDISTDKVIHL
jgi:hypothetical protein